MGREITDFGGEGRAFVAKPLRPNTQLPPEIQKQLDTDLALVDELRHLAGKTVLAAEISQEQNP